MLLIWEGGSGGDDSGACSNEHRKLLLDKSRHTHSTISEFDLVDLGSETQGNDIIRLLLS